MIIIIIIIVVIIIIIIMHFIKTWMHVQQLRIKVVT